MVSGMNGVRIYRQTTLTAMTALPRIMKGRNLPIFVLVRSIMAPMMGSVMASATRMMVTIREAKIPSFRILSPNWAT